MKKDIVLKDKKRGIYQITTTDERWYTVETENAETRLPEFKFIPSVTWITGYVYKGIEFYKWLANKGWDQAEAIKAEAGDKGSRVHHACELLIAGKEVGMEIKLKTNGSEEEKELTPEEYKAIVSFAAWFNKEMPEVVMNEVTIISLIHNFAGTVDFVCRINGQLWLIDFKTSQYIWPSMGAQISAYKHGVIEMAAEGRVPFTVEEAQQMKLGILQLGYRLNKRGYKLTELDDKFESLFLPAQQFWKEATVSEKPKQYELPIKVKLELKKKEEDDQKVKSI